MSKVLKERSCREAIVDLELADVKLEGDLRIPEGAKGIVLFVHGSGSSRHSPRNKFVAKVLNQANLATLLFDLLTAEEERIDLLTGQLRFDISFLAKRVLDATKWLSDSPDTCDLEIGYFGASTGAAAALLAASRLPTLVGAVVSRGGRPDLAGDSLAHVVAPTLLIVGERDGTVLQLNREAFEQLSKEKELAIVPAASHLFEEAGALEMVADLGSEWFTKYLSKH